MTGFSNVWVFAAVCVSGLCTLARGLLSDEVKTEIVNLHNTLRRNFATGADGAIVGNMRKLDWSVRLETVAQERLRSICAGSYSYRTGNIDQNSNFNSDSSGNFTGDILSWYNEIKTTRFEPIVGSCVPYRACLHSYTILNANHRHVGCANITNCRNGRIAFLCLYDGSASYPFYKRGATCSKCADDTAFCEDNLCVACDRASQNCDCRKTCVNPPVGTGTLNNSTCTCTCQYGMGANCDEECKNPEMYYDYDMCATVTDSQCADPLYEDIMQEFCPEQCLCNKFPTTI